MFAALSLRKESPQSLIGPRLLGLAMGCFLVTPRFSAVEAAGVIMTEQYKGAGDEFAEPHEYIRVEGFAAAVVIETPTHVKQSIPRPTIREEIPFDEVQVVASQGDIDMLQAKLSFYEDRMKRYPKARAVLGRPYTHLQGIVATARTGRIYLNGKWMSPAEFAALNNSKQPGGKDLVIQGMPLKAAKLTNFVDGKAKVMHADGVTSFAVEKLSQEEKRALISTNTAIKSLESPPQMTKMTPVPSAQAPAPAPPTTTQPAPVPSPNVPTETAGILDSRFTPDLGPREGDEVVRVRAIIAQVDGKILFGGYFATVNGQQRHGIARLNTDGSLDTAFNPQTSGRDYVTGISLQRDGKVLLRGEFYGADVSAKRKYIIRLSTDGSEDKSFDCQENGPIVALPDGKILIGSTGSFGKLNDDQHYLMARLNSDGSKDPDFTPGLDPDFGTNGLVIQPDGKILVGGLNVGRRSDLESGIARLHTDGQRDRAFKPQISGGPGEVSALIYSVAVQPDGMILISGIFSRANDRRSHSIGRLHADGSVDGGFTSTIALSMGVIRSYEGERPTVSCVGVQSDGKIILGGTFTSVNGQAQNCVARLNPDGSLDTTFNVGTGADDKVGCLAILPDGKILLGGDFKNVNGKKRNGIARLNYSGTSGGPPKLAAIPISNSAKAVKPAQSASLKAGLSDDLVETRARAEKGEAEAQASLAYSYEIGRGVGKDMAEAVKWGRKAAEQGLAWAQYNLGQRYADDESAIKDMTEAVKWWRKAAEQNNANAQYQLGVAYQNGEGVLEDAVEAVKWWRKAADQDLTAAQFALGVSYAKGQGVTTNLVEAYKWYDLAAADAKKVDGKRAAENRAQLKAQMTPQQIAKAQKLSSEWEPRTGLSGTSPSKNQTSTQQNLIYVSVLLILAIGGLGLAIWYVKRRKRSHSQSSHPTTDAQRFECPNCGQRIMADAACSGSTAACPSCNQDMVIPAFASAAQPLAATNAPPQ